MNSLLSLDTGKSAPDTILKDTNLLNAKDNIKINFKDFLSTLLNDLNKKDEKSLTAEIEIKSSKTIDKKLLSDKDNSSNDSKNILLNDILNLVVFLKSNGLSGKFPTETKKLNQILNNRQAFNDFKNIKSLKDIFQIAKKYNIDIKKFEFTKEEIKTIETKIIDIKKIKIKISSEKILQNIKNKNNIVKNNTKNSLKDLIITNNVKNDTKTIMVKNNTKNPLKDLIITNNVKNDTKTIKTIDKTKKVAIENISANKQNMLYHQSIKVLKNAKDTNQNHLTVKDSKIIEENPHIQKKADLLNKNKKMTQTSKTKIVSQTDNLENFSKDKKILKQNGQVIKHHASIVHTNLTKTHKTKNKIETNDQQFLEKYNNPNIKNDNIIHQTHNKQTDTKQTVTQFSNDLKQQIENYKPPFMRIKMTLSPKHLGEVDVSMVNRGNTLQITINSNTSTMAIFTQNQAEFKNSLVNMGFTNLNMNFSSNQNSSSKNPNNSQKNSKNFEELSDQEIEDINTLDITIPRYV